MRIGISIEKSRVSSVVVNRNGAILSNIATRMSGGLYETVKTNITKLVEFRRHEISHVFIGTDFVRAMLPYHYDQTPVGVIRLAGHRPDILMPCFNWPDELRERIFMGVETVDGGNDFNGDEIDPLCEEEIIEAANRLIQKNAGVIVICGVFSTFYPEQEWRAERIIKKHCKVETVCCNKLGIVGFMERENAGILNATFKKTFTDKVSEIKRVFDELNMDCDLYFTQTNGAALSYEDACLYPFQTIDSVILNAFEGATRLTQYENSCVMYMDEMGTFAKMMQKGLTPYLAGNPEITYDQFTVPNVYFANVGLNSSVTIQDYNITIGEPCDVLAAKTTFTLESALKICNGLTNFDEEVDVMTAYRVIKKAENMLVDFYKRINNRSAPGPLILSGPAAALFPQHESVVIAPFSNFSSAYGAAMHGLTACMTATMQFTDREEQVEQIYKSIIQKIIDMKGFEPHITCFQVKPFRYLPEEWAHVMVMAHGEVEPTKNEEKPTIPQDMLIDNLSGNLEKTVSYEIETFIAEVS